MPFKERLHLRVIKVQDVAVSADVEVAASYPEWLGNITNEGGYTNSRSFNVDKTALDWKEMQSRTFLARKNAWCQSFKGEADSLVIG